MNISETRLNVLLPKILKKNYKQYCIKNDLILSKRVRELIEKDMRGEIIQWEERK